jgi:NitT/TauT family transport system substrate-binding protein
MDLSRRALIAQSARTSLAAGIFGLGMSSRVNAQSALTPLTLVDAPTVDATAFYYGLKAGLFEKVGLQITAQTVTSGALGTTAVVSGSAQIGLSNTLSLAQAHEKNIPLSIISGAGLYDTNNPIAKIFVAVDSPIKTGKDLESKVVAVSSVHDLLAMSVKAWLASEGADYNQVKFLEIPQSSMAAALAQNRVDAICIFEPYASGVQETGKARVIGRPYDAIAKQFQVTAFYCYGPWLAAHKDLVTKFLSALKTATAYSNPHLSEMPPIVATYTGMTTDVVTKALKAKTSDGINPANVQPVIDLAARFGELKASFPAREIIYTP